MQEDIVRLRPLRRPLTILAWRMMRLPWLSLLIRWMVLTTPPRLHFGFVLNFRTITHLTALHSGQPGWALTNKNIHLLTSCLHGYYTVLECCNPWPHVANRHNSISQLLSLWCHSHYDVIRASRAYGARSPRSHYDVILIMTSFTTELATPSVTDVQMYGHLSVFNTYRCLVNFLHSAAFAWFNFQFRSGRLFPQHHSKFSLVYLEVLHRSLHIFTQSFSSFHEMRPYFKFRGKMLNYCQISMLLSWPQLVSSNVLTVVCLSVNESVDPSEFFKVA